MVEPHEGLHHELQSTTGFGRVSAMALLLARRGFRPGALTELFYEMVDCSLATHEVFATTASASVVGVSRTRKLLVNNPIYLAHQVLTLDVGHQTHLDLNGSEGQESHADGDEAVSAGVSG